MNEFLDKKDEILIDYEIRNNNKKQKSDNPLTSIILETRIRAGMTQAELSEKSGISQSDISRLEKGIRNPSIALLERLAEAMNSTLKIEFVPKDNASCEMGASQF